MSHVIVNVDSLDLTLVGGRGFYMGELQSGANLILNIYFLKNCIEMKKFGGAPTKGIH